MADKFYEKETKKRRKDGKFQSKFQDVIDAVSDRAQVLKAQGKNVIKESGGQTAKVAAVANASPTYFSNVVKNSPPKAQPPLPTRPQTTQQKCRFCEMAHQTESCQTLMQMGLQQRWEALKRAGFCYRCLTRGHRGKECPMRIPPICKVCKLGHQSMLHNYNPVRTSGTNGPNGQNGGSTAGPSTGAPNQTPAGAAQGGSGGSTETSSA